MFDSLLTWELFEHELCLRRTGGVRIDSLSGIHGMGSSFHVHGRRQLRYWGRRADSPALRGKGEWVVAARGDVELFKHTVCVPVFNSCSPVFLHACLCQAHGLVQIALWRRLLDFSPCLAWEGVGVLPSGPRA